MSGDLEEILKAINPEEWLDYLGVSYRKTTGSSGSQLLIKECPRCGGRGNKVYLNAETGLGKCFHGSCVGEPGFNLFSFTKHFEKDARLAFEEMERYARELGWRPKQTAKVTPVVTSDSTVKLPDSIELPQGSKNHPYLTARGITLETTAYLKLRYSKSGAYLYEDDKGQNKIQDYENRIVIPIFDLDGKLVTFQGRDISGKAYRKYLFPPGLPGTGRYLYNAHNAVGAKEVILNEGAFDVAATLQALKQDASLSGVVPIGTFGKSLTMGQRDQQDQLSALYVLKDRGLKRITLMWDAETKTLLDATHTADKLFQLGFDVRIARLPKDCDPNETTPENVRMAFYKAITVTKMSLLKFKAELLSR